MGVEVRRQNKHAFGLHLEIERIPAHTGKNLWEDAHHKEIGCVDQIEVKILGANHLEMRLTYYGGTKDEFVSEITYCGGFTVEWAA
jgi:hypothetical protein